MNYDKAYLHIFNRLTDIIELMESVNYDTELVDVTQLLKQLQTEGEEICIH